MNSADLIKKLSGLIGTALVGIFVIGLAQSISAGAAGFWGGLPFWVIVIAIMALVVYDLWTSCFSKK